MKHRKKISEPVFLNLEEELKSWRTLLGIKSQPKEKENKKENKEPKENTIQIIFLKKKQD